MEEECFCESGIASIEIPSRVEEIKSDSFRGCGALREVSFAREGRLRTIGRQAFAHSGLVAFAAPASLRQIGRGAFWDCGSLRQAELNEGLAVLGTNVLDSERQTEHGAFEESALERVVLPSTLERIQFRAFAGCKKLTGVALPPGLRVLSDGCFCSSGLAQVRIPDGVREIRRAAFADCTELRAVEFGASRLEEVGELAFARTALQKPRLPSAAHVARNAFERCRGRPVPGCAAQ